MEEKLLNQLKISQKVKVKLSKKKSLNLNQSQKLNQKPNNKQLTIKVSQEQFTLQGFHLREKQEENQCQNKKKLNQLM
jgi:hypothetical protein